MIDLSCTRGAVRLRLLAYTPAKEPVPEGSARAVVQAVTGGLPIAEDPLHIEIIPETELLQGLEISRAEGWALEPWKGAA